MILQDFVQITTVRKAPCSAPCPSAASATSAGPEADGIRYEFVPLLALSVWCASGGWIAIQNCGAALWMLCERFDKIY